MPVTRSKTRTRIKPKTKTKTKVSMSMPQVKDKAKNLGVTPGKMNKYDLIHAIQQAEYNNQCYGTSNGQCSNEDCCFMTDCLKLTA